MLELEEPQAKTECRQWLPAEHTEHVCLSCFCLRVYTLTSCCGFAVCYADGTICVTGSSFVMHVMDPSPPAVS